MELKPLDRDFVKIKWRNTGSSALCLAHDKSSTDILQLLSFLLVVLVIIIQDKIWQDLCLFF